MEERGGEGTKKGKKLYSLVGRIGLLTVVILIAGRLSLDKALTMNDTPPKFSGISLAVK